MLQGFWILSHFENMTTVLSYPSVLLIPAGAMVREDTNQHVITLYPHLIRLPVLNTFLDLIRTQIFIQCFL